MGSFGSIIKEIRKTRKLTQKMLSEDICSQSVLSRIENNEELPNVVVMQQICKRLGVTMDQIMQSKSDEVRQVTTIFFKMANFLRHKEYEKLYSCIVDTHIEDQIYLETDWQRYYYYLGTCEYFLYGNYDKAILDLKKGLSYTFQADKMNISDYEVQLMSCIGSTYSNIGQIEEAEKYLKSSIHYFNKLPNERVNVELTKIFYNYSKFLLEQGRNEEAQIHVTQGISWAQQKTSYYYLSELFSLQSELFSLQGRHEEATEFQKLSDQVDKIEQLVI
ncbi:helix-turn-helix transcriptional regulator [Enterococcus rivorum]|uniref:Cro/Cl family transcriptional regulator n=1 Tax=Enterococcus rivorum TaxID=762845 RepID=A0A1E5KZN4_9ENTE|nr:helix-turn-helix transcriptional regulator [Enterococcus rivorum]MBP2099309.1 transcriptional regulator with XRE-family HTH domain [Enterococcus rivorum]OEH83308.1 Cro/Cl family transcriptional regulator [Enterococcus rivorum]